MKFDSSEELFEEFKNSFSYGSRTDLNFKFLKNLCTQDAANFFQELLWKMGDSFNDGNLERLIEHVYAWQIRGYAGVNENYTYEEGPFTPIKKPVSESRMALLTSSGHFVNGYDPEPFGIKHMTQEQAIERIGEFLKEEPQLSHIPIDTPYETLRVRHGGYDIRGAQADENIVFPLRHLMELHTEGVIGDLAPEAYSFVGAASQIRLNKHAGPAWADMLKKQQVESVLLVPV